MFGSLKGRIVVILLVLVASGWFMYDNYSSCAEQRTEGDLSAACSPIKLGLDLQGGMHLVLEVEDREGTMTPESRADATDRALKIIRTRIDQFGVEEPIIQKVGEDRIIVELPASGRGRAKEILQQTAFLQFFLVKSGQEYQGFRNSLTASTGPSWPRSRTPDAGSVVTEEPARGESVEDLLFGGGAAETAVPIRRTPCGAGGPAGSAGTDTAEDDRQEPPSAASAQ
jgi:preprotein translocase subunit SecD